jgi:uridine kinase
MKSPDLPVCIGIAGSSCSGKTTLQNNLRQELGEEQLAVISFDDFFMGVEALDGGKGIYSWETPNLFRWNDYLQTITSLKEGRSARFATHSFDSVAAGITEKIIEPRRFIVAAGFLALHLPEINRLFDSRMFIDIPEEEMVRRRLDRAVQRQSTSWEDERYMKEVLIPGDRQFVQPQSVYADYIIGGLQPPEELMYRVMDVVDTFSHPL